MGSAPDPERIARGATYVREQLDRLRTVATITDVATFTAQANWMAVGAVRYALHTAVEALIDIAFHLQNDCSERPTTRMPPSRAWRAPG